MDQQVKFAPDQCVDFTVPHTDHGCRLELFLRQRLPHLTRGAVRRLLSQTRAIRVDGHPQPKGFRLRAGQRVQVPPALLQPVLAPHPAGVLSVIAETDAVVVIDKPAAIHCHPLDPMQTDTVANRLVARYPECATASPDLREAGLVHRLDHGTSGVLIAARQPAVYHQLRGLFGSGGVHKQYLALVAGRVEEPGQVDLPVHDLPAHTSFEPVLQLPDFTVVLLDCTTGRRHQVRVHMSSVGHPLAGDERYGGPPLRSHGPFLHALSIELAGQRFVAPLPADRHELLRALSDNRWPPPDGLDRLVAVSARRAQIKSTG